LINTNSKMIKKNMIKWFLKPIDNNEIMFDYLIKSFDIIYYNKNLNHLIINKKKMFTQYCNWVYFNSNTTIKY
jgi:hypothetical protein